MFEYKLYPTGIDVSFNPKYIVTMQPDGNLYTRIATLDGKTFVEAEYDVIKQNVANYLLTL